MSNHLVFHGIDDAAKADLEKYWTKKKLRRINKLLATYRPDRRDLGLTVSLHPDGPSPEWYEARAVLHLPTGTLTAEADEKDPALVLDLVRFSKVLEPDQVHSAAPVQEQRRSPP